MLYLSKGAQHRVPNLLETCYRHWAKQGLSESEERTFVAIDGKTARGSAYPASELDPIHVVSAWVDSQNLCLGQLVGTKKDSEIIQIPKLIEALKLKGCIVSIDAMGCQTDIAKVVREQEADYVLMVKNNQPNLLEEIEDAFDPDLRKPDSPQILWDSTADVAHGRIELRGYSFIEDIEHLDRAGDFAGARSIGKVTRRVVNPEPKGKDSVDVRYYLTSLSGEAALSEFMRATRGHWGIENRCHWLLDVVFREDACKVRNRIAASNLSLIRKICMKAVCSNTSHPKESTPQKMLIALLDIQFLVEIIESISL